MSKKNNRSINRVKENLEQYFLTVANLSNGKQDYRIGSFAKCAEIASHLEMPNLAVTIAPQDFVDPQSLGNSDLSIEDFKQRNAWQWFEFFYGGFESQRPELYETLQQRFWEQVLAAAGMLNELESDCPYIDSALSSLDDQEQLRLWEVFNRSVFDIVFHVHKAAMRKPPKPMRRYRKRVTV